MPDTLSATATVAVALSVVLGLIWLAARVLLHSRFARGQPGLPGTVHPPLAIGAVLALDSRRRVYLLTCQGRSVLLLTGGPADVLLGWLPEHPAA